MFDFYLGALITLEVHGHNVDSGLTKYLMHAMTSNAMQRDMSSPSPKCIMVILAEDEIYHGQNVGRGAGAVHSYVDCRSCPEYAAYQMTRDGLTWMKMMPRRRLA